MMIWCLVYISCIFLTGARDKNAYIRRDAHMWGIPMGDECMVHHIHHIQRNTQARQRENKNNDEVKKKSLIFFFFSSLGLPALVSE